MSGKRNFRNDVTHADDTCVSSYDQQSTLSWDSCSDADDTLRNSSSSIKKEDEFLAGKAVADDKSSSGDKEKKSASKALVKGSKERLQRAGNPNGFSKVSEEGLHTASKDQNKEEDTSTETLLVKHLTDTANLCQEVMQKLDAKTHAQRSKGTKGNGNTAELETLREQLSGYEVELKKVVEANIKWQTYNNQREEYVTKLHQEIEDLKRQLSDALNHGTITHDQQRQIDQLLLTAKEKTNKLMEEKEELEAELRTAKRENQRKDQTIQDLQDQLNNIRSPEGVTEDMVPLLQEQIRAITEDFECERKDRENAHAIIAKLENELQIARTKGYHQHSQHCYNYYPRFRDGEDVVDGYQGRDEIEADGCDVTDGQTEFEFHNESLKSVQD